MLPPAEERRAQMLYFCHAAATLLFNGETRRSTGEPAEDLGKSSLAAYRSAWKDFEEWKFERGEAPLPASSTDVARFLVARSDLARSTLKKRRAAISFVHRGLQFHSPTESPAAQLTWEILNEKKEAEGAAVGEPATSEEPEMVLNKGLRLLRDRQEDKSDRAERAEEPVFSEEALRYVGHETWDVRDLTADQRAVVPEPAFELGVLRDRALLLLGATAKLKRRELVSVRAEDLLVPKEGLSEGGEGVLLVGIRRPEGGFDRALELCGSNDLRYDAPRAVAAWAVAADLRSGPLARSFTPQGEVREKGMSAQGLNQMIKRRARQAGLPAGDWSARRLKESP